MSEFFRTQMGRKLIDGDIPKLVNVLERIAVQLERKNKLCLYLIRCGNQEHINYGR